MNPMMMYLQQILGADNFNNMMQKWQQMSPEQRQAELSKVQQMSPQEQQQYLMNRGIDINKIKGQVQSNSNFGNNNSRFKF